MAVIESHAQKPRGRKEHSRAGAPTQSPRRIRLIRVKDERGCRVMAAGSNLGGTAGYAYRRSCPELESNLFGTVFLKKRTEQPKVAHAGERKADDDAGNDRQKPKGRHSTLDEVLAMETAQATVHGLVHPCATWTTGFALLNAAGRFVVRAGRGGRRSRRRRGDGHGEAGATSAHRAA